MAQPVIGLTLDREPPGGYSKTHPWYALRENYCSAVVAAGGLPILLAARARAADGLSRPASTGWSSPAARSMSIRRCSAPRSRHASVTTKDRRTAFELAITRGALAARPAGARHLRRAAAPERRARRHPDPAHPRRGAGRARARAAQSAHRARPCRAHRARHPAPPDHRSDELAVNSAHHQAVKDAGRRHRRRRDGARRRDRGHRGSAPALLPRRAMASRIWPERRRPAHLRRLHRRLRLMAGAPWLRHRRRRRASASPSCLARAGLCSRRDAERWIADGRVSLARHGADLARPSPSPPSDDIRVDGKPLPGARAARGCGAITSRPGWSRRIATRRAARPCSTSLPRSCRALVSVGRLDLNSEGLLLLTNDGELARALELPASGWLRRYKVRVHGTPDPARLAALERGITIDGVAYGPIHAALERQQQASNAWLDGQPARRQEPRGAPRDGASRPRRDAAHPPRLRPVPARQLAARRARGGARRVVQEQLGDGQAGARHAHHRRPASRPTA